MSQPCYCGQDQTFESCCQPYLNGEKPVPSAEALMRSRYSAFASKKMDYIEATLDPQARGDYDPEANREWANTAQFKSLKILRSNEDGNKATIEFVVTYHQDGEDQVHHEVSKFRKKSGTWFFREGRIKSEEPAQEQ